MKKTIFLVFGPAVALIAAGFMTCVLNRHEDFVSPQTMQIAGAVILLGVLICYAGMNWIPSLRAFFKSNHPLG